jgi:hypothetical protein
MRVRLVYQTARRGETYVLGLSLTCRDLTGHPPRLTSQSSVWVGRQSATTAQGEQFRGARTFLGNHAPQLRSCIHTGAPQSCRDVEVQAPPGLQVRTKRGRYMCELDGAPAD